MIMKKICIITIIAVVLFALLCGCGISPQNNEASSVTAVQEISVTPEPTPIPTLEPTPEPLLTLTVNTVIIQEMSPLKFGSVECTDQFSEAVVLTGDVDKWFKNATVISGNAPEGAFSLQSKEINGHYWFVMAEDSRMDFVFSVDGNEYELSFGPGTQITVQKTDNGGYNLIADN